MAEEATTVLCASCGVPGRVIFEDGEIKNAFFVCKCPRPSVAEANESISRREAKS